MNRLFIASLKLNRFPVEEASWEFAQIVSIGSNRSEWAFLRFKEFEQNNPIYQCFLKSNGINNIEKWEEIPIIKKKDFQVNIEQITRVCSHKNLHGHNI